MLPRLPTLGIRFDLNKLETNGYKTTCWKILFQVVSPRVLAGASLFEGFSRQTLKNQENVFCLGVQHPDATVLEQVKNTLKDYPDFLAVCSPFMFKEGNECREEPLSPVGQFNIKGQIIGKLASPHQALDELAKKPPTAAWKKSETQWATARSLPPAPVFPAGPPRPLASPAALYETPDAPEPHKPGMPVKKVFSERPGNRPLKLRSYRKSCILFCVIILIMVLNGIYIYATLPEEPTPTPSSTPATTHSYFHTPRDDSDKIIQVFDPLKLTVNFLW